MKRLISLTPLFLTACINLTSTAAPVRWTQAESEAWALSLLHMKKQINDCYYHLAEEDYDQFNVDCDAMALGARLNDIITKYETQKGQFPDLSDDVFVMKEFGYDLDVAKAITNDLSAIDHMKGFIVSFALADTIINQ